MFSLSYFENAYKFIWKFPLPAEKICILPNNPVYEKFFPSNY
ncbi:hypothetical protein Bateq7PJ16_4190 [Bacillus subtilis]|nr:hypothetical protein Bateq7PJ16_4190 [Bacillus subtilis]